MEYRQPSSAEQRQVVQRSLAILSKEPAYLVPSLCGKYNTETFLARKEPQKVEGENMCHSLESQYLLFHALRSSTPLLSRVKQALSVSTRAPNIRNGCMLEACCRGWPVSLTGIHADDVP